MSTPLDEARRLADICGRQVNEAARRARRLRAATTVTVEETEAAIARTRELLRAVPLWPPRPDDLDADGGGPGAVAPGSPGGTPRGPQAGP
jgi:hypothetical protein